jgi:hypothetical protein
MGHGPMPERIKAVCVEHSECEAEANTHWPEFTFSDDSKLNMVRVLNMDKVYRGVRKKEFLDGRFDDVNTW